MFKSLRSKNGINFNFDVAREDAGRKPVKGATEAQSKSMIIPQYEEICKRKAFLASKRIFDHTDMQNTSIVKKKLEIERGAFMGGGPTRSCLSSFKEGVPWGAASIMTGEELCLYDPEIDWKKLYVHYGSLTKYGHLILAGSVMNFVHWTKSQPCQKEVRRIPSGRLYIYIEHKEEDENGKVAASDGSDGGKGYIVSVDKATGKSAPTVNNGKGYQLLLNGSYYYGYFRDGLRHGEGGTYFLANGDNYKARWVCDEIVCCSKCQKVLQEQFLELDPLLMWEKESNRESATHQNQRRAIAKVDHCSSPSCQCVFTMYQEKKKKYFFAKK